MDGKLCCRNGITETHPGAEVAVDDVAAVDVPHAAGDVQRKRQPTQQARAAVRNAAKHARVCRKGQSWKHKNGTVCSREVNGQRHLVYCK